MLHTIALILLIPAVIFALPADYTKNAEELENEFQGDMIISQEDLDNFNGLIDERRRWPNNIVPYYINPALFNEEQIAYIHLGAKTINDIGCVQLVNRTTESDYITVSGDSTGCSSYVGRIGGSQLLRLAPNTPGSGCFRLFTIVHEFLHALGFHHMQSSHDRDEYVEIVWENINPNNAHNFNIYGSNQVTHFSVPYDYGSVMHYPAVSFSINGQPTIIPLRDLGGLTMGQRTEMSASDILRLRRMYGCALVPH